MPLTKNEMSDHLYSNRRSKIGHIQRSYTRMRHIYDQLYHFRAAVLGILKKSTWKKFEKTNEANIETKTKVAREPFQFAALDLDETIVSLKVNFLYTVDSMKELFEIALQKVLYPGVTS